MIGGASLVLPITTMRLLGVERAHMGPAAYALRMFGVRDVVLGVALINTSGEQRRFWWKVGMACDVSDTLAAVIGSARGELPPSKWVRAFLIGSAVVGFSLGATALARSDV